MKKYFLTFIIIQLINNICKSHVLLTEPNSSISPTTSQTIPQQEYPEVTIAKAPPPEGYPHYYQPADVYTDIQMPFTTAGSNILPF